jgi:hypothetical protein
VVVVAMERERERERAVRGGCVAGKPEAHKQWMGAQERPRRLRPSQS